jgi:hypothetical protein
MKEGKYNEKEKKKLQSDRKEKEDRISFIQRYFPSFSQSPGGTQKLESDRDQEDRTKLKTPTRLLRKKDIAGRNSGSGIHASGEKRKSENDVIEKSSCSKKLRFSENSNFGKKFKFWSDSENTLSTFSKSAQLNTGRIYLAGPRDDLTMNLERPTGLEGVRKSKVSDGQTQPS